MDNQVKDELQSLNETLKNLNSTLRQLGKALDKLNATWRSEQTQAFYEKHEMRFSV